jgi:hypothetical protein
MLSLLALLPLLGTAFSNTAIDTRPQLDPSVPIYVGDVFWPPSMTFIAWLPSEVQKPLEVSVKGLTEYNENQIPYQPHLDVIRISSPSPSVLWLALNTQSSAVSNSMYQWLTSQSGATGRPTPPTTISSALRELTLCKSTTTLLIKLILRGKGNDTQTAG